MNQILGFCLVAISGLAFLDSAGESGPVYGLIGAGLGLRVPAVCTFIAVNRGRNEKVSSASYIAAVVIGAIGVLAYAVYLFTGPSNPDTAGHMLIVLFPMLYAIIAIFVFVPCLLIDRSRSKQRVT